MKMVVLDGYTLNPGDLSWSKLENLCNVEVFDRTPDEKIVERVGEAELILTNKTRLTKEVLEQLPNLKYIGVLATGYNVVDIDTAKERGIVVTNIPTYGTQSVAQFVFALLLEICHHVGIHGHAVKNGEWSSCPDFCFWKSPLIELSGKTMGIIGFGRIGQETAKIAQAFGMKVLAYDAYQNRDLETETLKYATLDEVYRQADVISLHCPLLDSTKGLINKKSLSMMKDGVILINTSRGPLIVENDLAESLKSGKVFAAGLDVVSSEPIKADNVLLKTENCIITPHIAWAPKEARERLLDIAVQNVEAFISGAPKNEVQ